MKMVEERSAGISSSKFRTIAELSKQVRTAPYCSQHGDL